MFYLIGIIILIICTLRNRLDILSVCTMCFIVYSIYCIPGIGISGYYRPKLSHELYYLIYLQIFIIFIFLFITRAAEKGKTIKFIKNNYLFEQKKETDVQYPKILDTSFYIYTTIMVVFAVINIIKIGFSGFAAGKANVWEESNIFFIISLYCSFPSFAYGLHNKKKMIWIPSLLIELTIFFAGSRAFLATLIVIVICEKGYSLWRNKKNSFTIYIFGAIAIVFLLIYRTVDTYIMNGDISGAIRVLQNPLIWANALEFNEPRVIIANYDYVLTSGIKLPIGDIVYRFIDFIPGMTRIIPIKLVYPEYFSDWLYLEVHGSKGVGGTIWGESYAMFGVFGVILFTILWLLFLNYSNRHLSYYKEYSCFVISLGIYLAWYINRLDFNRVGQVTKITLLCFLIWGLIYLILGGAITIFGRTIEIKAMQKIRERNK